MTQFQENLTFKGRKEKVWASYTQVNQWAEWDHSLVCSRLDFGDDPINFTEGATGWLQPKKGPKVKFVLTEVAPEVSFTSRSQLPLDRLPLASLAIEHVIAQRGDQVTITHAVTFSGPLGFLFGYLIGKEIKKDLPQALLNLSGHAPSNQK
ncbi:MAG: SRPBCC family protein [SAR324 cluster bacterium]|nr:SRPBCC family protein [SAR324 cluster bacterium]